MNDEKKFTFVSAVAAILTALVLAFAVLQDSFVTDFWDYARRRLHYEQVVSDKGLSLHEGMYWKEKQ